MLNYYKEEYNLGADDIDGWRVTIGENNHSLEYEVKGCSLHCAKPE